MKLITAIIVLTSGDPDLSRHMREAAAFIKTKPQIPGGHLCKETVRALLKLSKQKGNNRKGG